MIVFTDAIRQIRGATTRLEFELMPDDANGTVKALEVRAACHRISTQLALIIDAVETPEEPPFPGERL